jgi:hypothetical protein
MQTRSNAAGLAGLAEQCGKEPQMKRIILRSSRGMLLEVVYQNLLDFLRSLDPVKKDTDCMEKLRLMKQVTDSRMIEATFVDFISGRMDTPEKSEAMLDECLNVWLIPKEKISPPEKEKVLAYLDVLDKILYKPKTNALIQEAPVVIIPK